MKLTVVFGTRPEAIKLAPVIHEACRRPGIELRVISTGQHHEMLRPILRFFGIEPHVDLDLMRANQDLAGLFARALEAVSRTLDDQPPDALIVQGDTSTAFAAALAAAYRRIPVAHVEAGLRSDRPDAPFPEELNRRALGQLARWHFAPTPAARDLLLRDGLHHLPTEILVTGNTVIDALDWAVRQLEADPPADAVLAEARAHRARGGRLVLVTGHRRESFGAPLRALCEGLRSIVDAHPAVRLVYPVHLNPNVREPVGEILGGHDRITLAPPFEYPAFVAMMREADLIITDSGGVQEEAPALGKPVLVTREVTERPEAVAAGGVILVGPDRARIVAEAGRLLGDEGVYTAMARPRRPYGDGRAATRILDALEGRPVTPFVPEAASYSSS